MTIGIIGCGAIGSAVFDLFPSAFVYDPRRGFDSEKAFSADFNFICVPTLPTPFMGSGLDASIVAEVVGKCQGIIIICSTLQPGDADKLAEEHHKDVVVQPHYFGESVGHPFRNLQEQPFLILGGKYPAVNKVIDLYKTVYNANIRIRRVSRLEAEIIKLSENRAIAFKVAQCQELYDACMAAGVDYNTIREAVYGDDPRFNLWWTFIYENRGFNSKCIPKDVYAWKSWCRENGANSFVTDAILLRNEVLIGEKCLSKT